MTVLRWLGAGLAIVSLCASPAVAQTDQGRIAGNVRDSSGAFATGVAAKVKNEKTGEERTVHDQRPGLFPGRRR